MNTNQKDKGILSLISSSIYMNGIHEHPLLFCSPLDRKQYGNSWSCNKCKSTYNYDISSFYCTFCDFDLCPKCLAEYQLYQIKFYNCQSIEANNLKLIQQNQNDFQWKKKFKNHTHLLTLIQKENKNFSWACDNCSKNYQNTESSFYCSLCDYDVCKQCFTVEEPKPQPVFPIIPVDFPPQDNKVNNFHINSFKKLNEDYKNKNLIYSPLSIQILLTLLTNGLSGQSLAELKKIFLFQDLNQHNNKYMNLLSTLTKINSLKIVSAIFSPFEPSDNFRNYIYRSDKTNNKINDFYEPSSIMFGMVLASAMYFKVGWKKKFQETSFQKKFFSKNNEKNVKMMNLIDDFKYYKDLYLEVIEIPYIDDNLCAYIFLPSKDISVDTVINALDQEKYQLFNKLKTNYIDLTIPKFSFNEKINLNDMLKKTGINSIFSSFSQDLNPIFGKSQNISINEFLQRNYIEVDEDGNESNMFGIFNRPLKTSKNMVVNRPFLFIIRNKSFEIGEDIILFAKIEDIY